MVFALSKILQLFAMIQHNVLIAIKVFFNKECVIPKINLCKIIQAQINVLQFVQNVMKPVKLVLDQQLRIVLLVFLIFCWLLDFVLNNVQKVIF